MPASAPAHCSKASGLIFWAASEAFHPENDAGRRSCAAACRAEAPRISDKVRKNLPITPPFIGRHHPTPGSGRAPAELLTPERLRQVGGEAVDALEITLHSIVEAFGDALPVLRLLQHLFIGGIAQERDLREDGGHVGANQDNERSLPHAAVLQRASEPLQALRERILDVGGQLARLFNLFVARDLLDQVLQLVDG